LVFVLKLINIFQFVDKSTSNIVYIIYNLLTNQQA